MKNTFENGKQIYSLVRRSSERYAKLYFVSQIGQ